MYSFIVVHNYIYFL